MTAQLALRYLLLESSLDERTKRLWAASEALALGSGGLTIVSEVTSLTPGMIRAGIRELQSSVEHVGPLAEAVRLRRRGAGRKPLWLHDERLEDDLRSLLESWSDIPSGPLEWTCKSTRRLAGELTESGHQISYRTVATMLTKRGFRFSPMSSGYRRIGLEERRAQFIHLSRLVLQALERQQPVLSITINHSVAPNPQRKQSMRPGPPDRDLALLTVAHLRRWWRTEGRRRFPRASSMILISDSSGSLHDDREMWHSVLLAGGDGELRYLVSHLPPGATRWKQTEPVGWIQIALPEPFDQHRRIHINVVQVRPHRGIAMPHVREEDQPDPPGLLEDWNYVVAPDVGSRCS